jgi:hypothetical protein
MTHPPPHPDLTALREEIRRVGRGVRGLRLMTWGYLFGPALFVVLVYFGTDALCIWNGCAGELRPMTPATFVAGLGPVTAAGTLFLLAVAIPTRIGFRYIRARALRAALANLTPTQGADLLLPLQQDCLRDTRELAADLLRDFGVPTEVAPAPVPAGRGDEVTVSGEDLP